MLVESANQFSLEELCRTQYSLKYFFRSHVDHQTYGKTLTTWPPLLPEAVYDFSESNHRRHNGIYTNVCSIFYLDVRYFESSSSLHSLVTSRTLRGARNNPLECYSFPRPAELTVESAAEPHGDGGSVRWLRFLSRDGFGIRSSDIDWLNKYSRNSVNIRVFP